MTQATVCASDVHFAPSSSTGKERDTESGNDYFGARYYNSTMGRFMSPDWSAKEEPVPYAKLDDPQTLNLYAYVRNHPTELVDADGHQDAPAAASSSSSSSSSSNNGSSSDKTATTNASVPTFNELWDHYPTHHEFDSSPLAKNSIWKGSGGYVEKNEWMLTPQGIQGRDTCALRLSWAINLSGWRIPGVKKETVSAADHSQYYLQLTPLSGLLTKMYGQPKHLPPGSFSGPPGETGIIIFKVHFDSYGPNIGGSSGHGSLWNGSRLIDSAEEDYGRWSRPPINGPYDTLFWRVK